MRGVRVPPPAIRASLGTRVAQLCFVAAGVPLGSPAGDWRQRQELQRDVGGALCNPRRWTTRVFPFLVTFGGYLEDPIPMSRQLGTVYRRTTPVVDSAIARLPG